MFPDNNAGVAALQTGRVDGYFLDYVVGTDYIDQHPELVQPIAVPAFDQPAAFPIKKGNTALEDGVNKALGELAPGRHLDEAVHPVLHQGAQAHRPAPLPAADGLIRPARTPRGRHGQLCADVPELGPDL